MRGESTKKPDSWKFFLANDDNKRQIVVVVNHCFTSLFGTKGLLSDIIIR